MASAELFFQRDHNTIATIAKTIINKPGITRRQMNRSIVFSASKFSAQRGQPRAL
jgi:hypothetical protein